MKNIKDKIIENGIKNMKEFGYPSVNKDNIFTDVVYKQFFKSMLNDNLGKGADKEIKELLLLIS